MASRMSEREAKQLVNQAVGAGQNRWRDFEESFREMLCTGLESIDLAESAELDDLRAVVGDLERQLFGLETPSILSKRI